MSANTAMIALMLSRELRRRSREVRTLERKNKRLEASARASHVDWLTGVSKREVFERKLKELLLREKKLEQRAGYPIIGKFALIFIDIDHFKGVNDTRGHAAGDRVLKRAAKLLKGSVRKSDMIARWGGDEFVVLLWGAGSDSAAHTAETMRKKFESFRFPGDFFITASFGVCSSEEVMNLNNLHSLADDAVYNAKHAGGNMVVTYSPAPALHGESDARFDFLPTSSSR